MIFLKTEDEIELLRQSNLLVGRTLAEVAKLVKPGVTTKELDKVAEEFIRDHGAVPQSTETISPSFNTISPGIPCTTSSLTDVHNEAGNGSPY